MIDISVASSTRSNVQRAGREDLLELHPARAQALFVDVLRDGLQHGACGLEPVGERIVLRERALDAAVEQAAFEVPVQIRAPGVRDLLLRGDEGGIEVERDPGTALQQRT